MRSKIQNRGNPQLPEAAQNPDMEDDLSVYFDKRAEDNEGIISSSKPKNIGESIKIFLQSMRDKISNWFQSAKDFIRSKLPGYQNSRALMNIRQYSAPLGENSEKNPPLFLKVQPRLPRIFLNILTLKIPMTSR